MFHSSALTRLRFACATAFQCAQNYPTPFLFDPDSADFRQVKVSWLFLGGSLLSSLVVFPFFKFGPPRAFGAALIAYYLIFMTVTVLVATGHISVPF